MDDLEVSKTGDLCPSCGILLSQIATVGCNDPFGCAIIEDEEIEDFLLDEDEEDMGIEELNFDEA
jgi:hypothetical protein